MSFRSPAPRHRPLAPVRPRRGPLPARLVGAIVVAVVLSAVTACGGSSTDQSTDDSSRTTTDSSASTGPQPVPASNVALTMPDDLYLHPGAPTEWWWHIGTLRAGDRTFGFEINTASFAKDGFAFTQIMLSDIEHQRHYQRTTPYLPPVAFDSQTWAQSDVSEDWYARLGDANNRFGGIQVIDPGRGYTTAPQVTVSGDGTGGTAMAQLDATGGVSAVVITNPGTGYTTAPQITIAGDGAGATATAFPTYVSMRAPAADPTRDMRVQALLTDDPSMTPVEFDLTFSQEGRPFYVWGTGENGPGEGLQENNYYVSLTRMHASGTITLDGETFAVEGVTWMDHEYGAFGTAANPVKWILQDMQLDNGFSVSNAGVLEDGAAPQLDVAMDGYVTLQNADGDLYLEDSRVTPLGPTWTSPVSGATYFTQFRVEIPSFEAEIVVSTLLDGQEFPIPGSPVYEGVATAKGTFQGADVIGDAWIEQTF